MPAGFQCLNDSGVFQVDDAYRNLHLVASGSGNLGNANMSAFTGALASCSSNAMVAWVLGGAFGGFPLMGEYVGGVRKTVVMRTEAEQAPAQWYIFDLVNPVSSQNFGVEIFTANGTLSFSSSGYQARILDFIPPVQLPSNSVETDFLIYENRTGREVAYMPVTSNFYYDFDNQNVEIADAYIRMEGTRVIANTMYWMMDNPALGITVRTAPLTFSALVVDVTTLPKTYNRG